MRENSRQVESIAVAGRSRRIVGLVAILALGWGIARIAQISWDAANLCLANANSSRLSRRNLHITPSPPWVRNDVPEQTLQQAGLLQSNYSLLEPDLVERLGKALERSPWVQSVRVRKGYHLLEIQLTYRKPVLCLVHGEAGLYLSADGTLLPWREVSLPALRSSLVVEGISEVRLPAIGRRFSDPRVIQASRLAGLLHPQKDRLGLCVLRVHSAPGQPFRCELLTKDGSVIHWGAAADPDAEASNGRKLSWLLNYHHQHGGLALPNGPYRFELAVPRLCRAVRTSEPRPNIVQR